MLPSISLDQMGSTGNQQFFYEETSFYHSEKLEIPVLDDYLCRRLNKLEIGY
jgi:hypothetical protein